LEYCKDAVKDPLFTKLNANQQATIKRYASGESMGDIAKQEGHTDKAIHNRIVLGLLRLRKAKNPKSIVKKKRITGASIVREGKMTHAEYIKLHDWVRSQRGKPRKCDNCGVTDRPQYYWANISHEYKWDLSDWARLCGSCHQWFDKGGTAAIKDQNHCIHGHELTPENVYKYPNSDETYCRPCRLKARRDAYRRRRNVEV